MSEVRPWVPRALLLVAGITLLLLVTQYLLGLWTNLYGPSNYTSDTSFASLDWHYNIGYAVFVVAVIMLVFAAMLKEPRLIGPSVGAVVTIALAGVFGMLFVRSNPNAAADSFLMGLMFILAFGATMNVLWSSWSRRTARPEHGASSAGSSPAG